MRIYKEVPLPAALSLLVIIAIFPFATGILPTVNFISEKIHVDIYPSEIEVQGHYFYKNPFPFPVMQGFSIPFPVDETHPEPFEVHAERLTPQEEARALRRNFGNTHFEVYFWPHEEIEIKVTYRQEVKETNGEYILLTTKPWGRPLDSGLYTISTHGTTILSSNYTFNLENGVLGFQRMKFMPEKNWQFSWRTENEKKL